MLIELYLELIWLDIFLFFVLKLSTSLIIFIDFSNKFDLMSKSSVELKIWIWSLDWLFPLKDL